MGTSVLSRARQESLRPLQGMLPFPRHAACGWIWEHRPAYICNALSERLNDRLRGLIVAARNQQRVDVDSVQAIDD